MTALALRRLMKYDPLSDTSGEYSLPCVGDNL